MDPPEALDQIVVQNKNILNSYFGRVSKFQNIPFKLIAHCNSHLGGPGLKHQPRVFEDFLINIDGAN